MRSTARRHALILWLRSKLPLALVDTLYDMPRHDGEGGASRRQGAGRAELAGAGTVSVTGTGRIRSFVDAVIRDDPWARDAAAIHSDFRRALDRVESEQRQR